MILTVISKNNSGHGEVILLPRSESGRHDEIDDSSLVQATLLLPSVQKVTPEIMAFYEGVI